MRSSGSPVREPNGGGNGPNGSLESGPVQLAESHPDLLTTLLEPCRYRATRVAIEEVSPPWNLDIGHAPVGFYAVLDGVCALLRSGRVDDRPLEPGDVAIVLHPGDYRLRNRSDERGRSPEGAAAERAESGHHTRLLCGWLTGEDDYTRQTLALLPPLVVLNSRRSDLPQWHRALADMLLAECEEPRPGGVLVVNRALQVLLIEALRQTAVELPDAAGGLLGALRVPGLGATVAAMHSQPEREWTVQELAEMAGLSRAAFAVRFVEMFGEPPFHYLRELRMRLACRMLDETAQGIKLVAARVGYATEASFSKAFTRWSGRAPGEYRRRSRESEGSARTTGSASTPDASDS